MENGLQKVLVIGCPGSGKSTFSRALRERTALPLHHLDLLHHRPDRSILPREDFDRALEGILASPRWIIDGNYLRTLPRRLECCDTVFWLDYPTEVCLRGVRARFGTPRPDMPWVEVEEDAEFMDFIRAFRQDSRPLIQAELARHPEKRLRIFTCREEADAFLAALN